MSDLREALGCDFNAEEVEITEYEPLPEGEYLAHITSAELKDTRSGKMIEIDYSIVGTSSDGRVVKDRVNIVNSSEKAEKYAKQTLAKICNAVNVKVLKSTTELVGKKLNIKLIVEQQEGTYVDKYGQEKPRSPQNAVKGYYPANNVSSPSSAEKKEKPSTKVPAWADDDNDEIPF